jgi:hypothetical protein
MWAQNYIFFIFYNKNVHGTFITVACLRFVAAASESEIVVILKQKK